MHIRKLYSNTANEAITYTNAITITFCRVKTHTNTPINIIEAFMISEMDWYSICSYALNNDVKIPQNALIITDEPIRYTTYFIIESNVPILTNIIRAPIVIRDNINFILPWLPRYLAVLFLSRATSRMVNVDNPKSVKIANNPDIAVANEIIPKLVVPKYLAEYKV